jgi:phosphopantothenoylcysteine decarboxylase/phosphopantothenate--cysteine ligase
MSRFTWSDTVIMAAAVADFRPAQPAQHKLKKRHRPITQLALTPTADILQELGERRTTQVLVGFAAETEDLLAHAREKLQAKDVDLLVANDVTAAGSGFGSDTNRVVLLAS